MGILVGVILMIGGLSGFFGFGVYSQPWWLAAIPFGVGVAVTVIAMAEEGY